LGAFLDSVGDILSRVERRVEVAAQNISNSATPGYKRALSFESLVATPDVEALNSGDSLMAGLPQPSSLAVDLASGQLQNTGNPTDLAVSGAGFFAVRTPGQEVLYTRQGQFHRDADGHLLTAHGAVLQQRGGGDLVLKPGDFKVLDDGAVVQAGEPVGRIAIADFSDAKAVTLAGDGLYSAPDATIAADDAVGVRQGALEASNVGLGAEMMTIMSALRQAQSGQHLMNTYDDLMGRAITTFGQG
jgi:flagellar basal body rod protein FlgG